MEAIDYHEFASATRSLLRKPMKLKHRMLARIRTNTLSEIQVLSRVFLCQTAVASLQFKDAVVNLHQIRALLLSWKSASIQGSHKHTRQDAARTAHGTSSASHLASSASTSTATARQGASKGIT